MIGLYIHIPFCSNKCPYCDFVSFSADNYSQKKYTFTISSEISSKSQQIKDKTIDTIFIGGGTPSVLYRGGLYDIVNEINKQFSLNLSEFTVEANPESASKDFFAECKEIGVNRLSFGLQSTKDSLLKDIRRHTYKDFLNALDMSQKVGISNINADLMLGFNNQTVEDVTDSIMKLTDLGLKHISVYGLKIEENTPFYRQNYKIDEDLTENFYQKAYKLLKERDYIRYEVSNFCLHGYECKHNLKYWQLSEYLGVGLNASSYINQKRIKNTSDFNEYLDGKFVLEEEDAGENFLTEYIMLSLRTNKGIDLTKVDILANKNAIKYLNQGILIKKGNNLVLNDDYYYLMNKIIVDLL